MASNIVREFTLLLVDDRPENNILLEEMLEKENRRFIHVSSGDEALKVVLNNPQIGLIMLDVQMPEMDGFEVARIIKSNAKTKNIAIIFVTAINKQEQYVLQGFEEGAVDYLEKPLNVNVTRAKVAVFEKLFFYQENLKASMNELGRVNKQLENFVHIVSHDLKSPLASIITILSSLKGNSYVEDHPDILERFDLVYISACHLSDMINSILQYSKQSIGGQVVEEVDVYDLVNQVIFLLFPPPHIKINVSEDLPVLHTTKAKLQQVFQNLISNAIKYMDKPEGIIEIKAIANEGYFTFLVRDNGPGIANRDTSRIFKLFEVTENKSNKDSSTGIGLNIVKLLVEEQGGKIWVNSEEGKGSTFYFDWRK